jgi:hypothetical protein
MDTLPPSQVSVPPHLRSDPAPGLLFLIVPVFSPPRKITVFLLGLEESAAITTQLLICRIGSGFFLFLLSLKRTKLRDPNNMTFTPRLFSSALGLALAFMLAGSCHHATEPPPPPDGVDTTSHNFVWTVLALGDGSGSILRDVAIINDTLAYAVGEMYLNDSSGQINPAVRYNYAVYNGKTWMLGILPYSYQGSAYVNPIRCVLAFASDDIWFGGNGISRWNGSGFVEIPVPVSAWPGEEILRMWGTSKVDMFIVGRNGAIAHFNGSQWQPLPSGTTLPIQDIWGAKNPLTGLTEVYAVASNYVAVPSGKRLLRLEATSVTTMSDSGLNVFLNGIWFPPGGPYYIAGGGYWASSSISQSTKWEGGPNTVTKYYSLAIRGNASNDMFLAGAYGDLVHYNGSTWKSFQSQAASVDNFWGLAIKGNLVVAAGAWGDRAVVAVGRRH